MKILVTGGAGFIGSHLCAALLNRGHEVVAYDNLLLGKEKFLEPCKASSHFRFVKADLLDRPMLEKNMDGIEAVFHLAANSDISHGATHTHVDLELGTIATYNTLEAMRKCGVKKIVFASTSAIYGEADQKPTPESYGPLFPISFYGASKLACEGLVSAFSHNYDIQAFMYRFANIVGSHSTHGAIHDFVKRLKKEPEYLQVLGNGTQKKSYLHVSDCVSGLLYGFENLKDSFQCFNLASQGVTTVKFIAEEVVNQLGGTAEIRYESTDRGWRGDVPFTWLDGTLYHSKGWQAHMNSDEAVQKAVGEIIKEINAQ